MFQNVLVPVDIGVPEDAQTLLAATKTLCAPWDATLHVVTVVPDMGLPIVGSYFDENFETDTRGKIETELDKAVAEAGVTASTHVMTGRVYETVLAVSKKLGSDLIIVGAHRPGIKDYLLGTNAAKLVRHADTSVMVIRDT